MTFRLRMLLNCFLFLAGTSCVTKNSKEEQSDVKRSILRGSCVQPRELQALITKNFDNFRNSGMRADYTHFHIEGVEAKKIRDRPFIPIIADGQTIWQFAFTVTDDRRQAFNERFDKCLLEEKTTLYCNDGEDTYIYTNFKRHLDIDEKIDASEDKECSLQFKAKLAIDELYAKDHEIIPWGRPFAIANMSLIKKASSDGSVQIYSENEFIKNSPSAVCSLAESSNSIWLPAQNKCP